MTEPPSATAIPAVSGLAWPRRYTIVVLFALATALCYVDRVNISIAIIPLALDKGYDPAARGLILSAFFWGYLWPQMLGGWLADRLYAKRVDGRMIVGTAAIVICAPLMFLGLSRPAGDILGFTLLMGLGSVVIGALFAFVFFDMARALQPYRIADLGWSWPALAVCFVLDDFIYYWWHRASHRVRWLWADHVNHHSSQHYNLSTALRQPWGGQFTPGFLFRAPLVLFPFA